MIETSIKHKIESVFSGLLQFGYTYSFSEGSGILNDRELMIFDYDNTSLRKKVSVVYCKNGNNSRLYGFLINYSDSNPTITDYKNLISFNRLKCFLNENETKFFGSEQFELDFQLKEFKLLIQKFHKQLTSKEWIDISELENKEESIYVFSRRHGDSWWVKDIKKSLKNNNSLKLEYDYSVEMPYEAYGIRLKNKYGLEFHITFGHKTRDDTVFAVQAINSGKAVETIEFENAISDEVISYIENKVSH